MRYRLINHTTRLLSATYLQSIYDLSNGGNEHIYGCVPNGEIGISVILKGESHTKTETGWKKQPPISVYGLVSKVQFHKMSPYYHEINFGFSPHILQLFIKDSLYSLSKTYATDLSDLVGGEQANRLFENLMQSNTDDKVSETAEEFLKKNLQINRLDKRIIVAHQMITEASHWQVQNLSSYLNISSTTLRNLFKEQVGISPKDLIKILRIKKALDYKTHCEESITQLAYHLHYFDQAHFIHDFKDTIGITPNRYFSNTKLTFDFYNFRRWSYDSFVDSIK